MPKKTLTKYELEKIREIPIAKILGKPVGRRFSVRCVYHQERTPSLVIFPDNSFHCFGCGKHGKGAIDFVMKMGFSFKDALQELADYL